MSINLHNQEISIEFVSDLVSRLNARLALVGVAQVPMPALGEPAFCTQFWRTLQEKLSAACTKFLNVKTMQNFTVGEFWQAVSSGAAQADSQNFRAAINPPASCQNWLDPAYLYRYVLDGDIAGCWILHDIEAALNIMSTVGDNPGGDPGESIKFGCTLNSQIWLGFGQNPDQQVAITEAVKSWKVTGATELFYPRAYSYLAAPTTVAATAYQPEYYLQNFELPAGSTVNIEVWCKIIREGQTFNSFNMPIAENAWCKYHTFKISPPLKSPPAPIQAADLRSAMSQRQR